MLFVGANFQKFDLISLLYAEADFFEHIVNIFVKYHSSILRRKHQVVHQHRHVVALVYVFAHLPRIPLRPKGRGIYPQ